MKIYQKNYNVFTSILKMLKVRHTNDFSNKYFNEHSDRYSLLGISQMLSDYGVRNEGIKIENKEQDIFNIECPFIAHVGDDFMIVYKVNPNKIRCFWNGRKISIPFPQFIRTWSGIALLTETMPDSIEPDYKRHQKKELLSIVRRKRRRTTVKTNIAFCFNTFHAKNAAVAMASLLDVSRKKCNYNIFCIICDDVTDKQKEMLVKIKKDWGSEADTLTFLKPTGDFDNASRGECNYPPVVYYRLMLPELLPDFDKIIYADIDTLFQRDLADLESVDLKENLLAAVSNYSSYGYFNAGFLIMNLKQIRAENLYEKWIEAAHTGQNRFADQDVLNKTCGNRWVELPLKYNFTPYHLSLLGRKRFPRDAVMLHWITEKPFWEPQSKPHQKVWYRFAQQTGLFLW